MGYNMDDASLSSGCCETNCTEDGRFCINCDKILKRLQKKYGAGELFNQICEKCGYESQDLYSSGVHQSASGCLRIYTEDDEFKCTQCEEQKYKEATSSAIATPVTPQSSATPPSISPSAIPSSSAMPSSLSRPSVSWQEHRSLFGFQTATSSTPAVSRKRQAKTARPKEPKKKKEPTWTRTFVCLNDKRANKVASSGEYASLKNASLGEKKLTFLLSDTCHSVDAKLKEAYPKLELAGGYSLACSNITRKLQKIDPPYSALLLKEATGQGKIFIIPLQRSLDLTPDVLPEDGMVICLQ